MKRITGIYEKLGDLDYFTPHPLPPKDPILTLDAETIDLYGLAMNHLGQLNEIAKTVPNEKRFIKAYVIKEALLSSAIEGIHTTLIDIFTQPLSEKKPNKETQLILNYVKSLTSTLRMIKDENFPIVSRVILKAHECLMSTEANTGGPANPGHYRKQSVRVGNLIPPHAQKISPLMTELEEFINTDNSLSPLIKAGLAHVQFETIHPFLDGNGRIGRLLIVLMLIDSNLLQAPIIYPSYYFKKNHHEYYVHLDRVRTEGDFEGWIKYYLKAIIESSKDAYERAKEIGTLDESLRQIIQSSTAFNSIERTALDGLSVLFEFPIINATELSKHLKKSYNTANNIIKKFTQHGILTLQTLEKQRNKIYHFSLYLAVLEKEY